MRERYYELWRFFSGYFFQDWYMEYDDSPLKAIHGYIEDHSVATVKDCIVQLRQLLALDLDEESLEKTVTEDLHCSYYPLAEGKTYRQWLEWVGRELAASVDASFNQES